MILRSLATNLESVLARISTSHLERYRTLRDDLSEKNVASDAAYQSTFNGFYKVQRRKKDWYGYYFSLLQEKKGDATITFEDVIEQIFSGTGRVEPSFSSKLVATIRPEMPVYDKHVRENLSLTVPAAHRPARDRVEGFISAYSSLEKRIAALVADPIFVRTLRPAFDKRFASYAQLTDVKKLDFLLWQYRP